jgi:hypothetical protein
MRRTRRNCTKGRYKMSIDELKLKVLTLTEEMREKTQQTEKKAQEILNVDRILIMHKGGK